MTDNMFKIPEGGEMLFDDRLRIIYGYLQVSILCDKIHLHKFANIIRKALEPGGNYSYMRTLTAKWGFAVEVKFEKAFKLSLPWDGARVDIYFELAGASICISLTQTKALELAAFLEKSGA